MEAAERRALIMLLGLAVAGHGVRVALMRPGEAPGQVELLAALPPGRASAQLDSARAAGRPLRPGERIDLDRASAADIARLPRVGPRLARAIVADREARGGFGDLAGLDRVPGVGPGLLETIRPYASFSAPPGGARNPGPAAPDPAPVDLNSASEAELLSLPGIGPARARAIIRYRNERGRFSTPDEVALVPGIPPSVVARMAGRVVTR